MKRRLMRWSVLFLVLGGVALFAVRSFHLSREMQVAVTITNGGRPVHFINLGETRWSGAAYALYRPGQHVEAAAGADAGAPVVVAPGSYDIEVSYSDGEKIRTKWLSAIDISRNPSPSIELGVPPEEIGSQVEENSWRP